MENLSGLLTYFKDKVVEIYVGDQFEEIQLSDHAQQVNGAIYGKLVDVVGDFVVIDCFYLSRDGVLKTGNVIFINSWQIVAITTLDGQGTLSDVFMSTVHATKIQKAINVKDK